MKLSEVIRAVQGDLPVTMRHDQWLTKNSNATYSAAAVEFAKAQLRGETQNRKRQLFRASGIGTCARRRMFAAIGVPEKSAIDSGLANIFHTGNFLHLKWQLAGLTEGWLKQAEVVMDNSAIRFGGTLDGIIFDGSGFEFKSINDNGYRDTWVDPKTIHVRQVHSYMYLNKEIKKFSVVYENKNTGEWRELRVHRDPAIIRSIDAEIGQLNEMYEARKLPPVLPDCSMKLGTAYRQCPFKDMCLRTKQWPVVRSAEGQAR